MINKFLKKYKEYEIAMNRTLIDRKTPMQMRIEIVVSNCRGYETVPCIRAFGEKIALKSWLKFAKKGFICNYNYEEKLNPLKRTLEETAAIMFEYISTIQKMSEKSFS